MAMQLGFDLIRETFTNTTVFGVNWILTAIFTLLIISIICGKDWGSYKTLILPVTIGLHVVGMVPSILQYVIGAIILVMETLSLEMLGNIAETATTITRRTAENIGMITSKIYDRPTYQAVKEEWRSKKETGLKDTLSKYLTKKKTTGKFEWKRIGTDKNNKPIMEKVPIYTDVTDITALEQARLKGLGGTIAQSRQLDETKAELERMEKGLTIPKAKDRHRKKHLDTIGGIDPFMLNKLSSREKKRRDSKEIIDVLPQKVYYKPDFIKDTTKRDFKERIEQHNILKAIEKGLKKEEERKKISKKYWDKVRKAYKYK